MISRDTMSSLFIRPEIYSLNIIIMEQKHTILDSCSR